jgi:phenylalanyl-tRNA synthetase beta subunit
MPARQTEKSQKRDNLFDVYEGTLGEGKNHMPLVLIIQDNTKH